MLPLASNVISVPPFAAGNVIVDDAVSRANGTPLVAAHPATNLFASIRCACAKYLLVLGGEEPRSQNGKSAGLVAMLRALRFAANYQTARLMTQLDRAIGYISMLPACARTATRRPFEVRFAHGDLSFGWLRKDGYGDSGSLNATIALGWWDALPTMATGLVGKMACAIDNPKDENAGTFLNKFEVKDPSAGRASSR